MGMYSGEASKAAKQDWETLPLLQEPAIGERSEDRAAATIAERTKLTHIMEEL